MRYSSSITPGTGKARVCHSEAHAKESEISLWDNDTWHAFRVKNLAKGRAVT